MIGNFQLIKQAADFSLFLTAGFRGFMSAFLGEAAEDEEAESVEAASAAAAVADELASEE